MPSKFPRARRVVLVIDDNADVQELFSSVLVGEGHRVLVASDGLAALDVLAEMAEGEEAPSLILVDLMMPVMDGPTFVRQLRAIRDDIPVVVVTASGETVVEGAAEVIAKPLEAPRLRELVQSYFH